MYKYTVLETLKEMGMDNLDMLLNTTTVECEKKSDAINTAKQRYMTRTNRLESEIGHMRFTVIRKERA